MGREFPIWIVVLLPWIGALACLVVARPGVRLLGRERARVAAHYLGLGASTLALLFVVQIIDHLLAPEDPRALAHTPMRELLGPLVIGELRMELTLVADRLSSSAALVISALSVVTRIFVPGPAGQRALGLGDERDDPVRALRRLASLGVVEGGALLVVLAGDLALAAVGWALLGVGAAVAAAREVDDERRASAATRIASLGVAGDLALGAMIVALVVSGIGLSHNAMWAPLTGDRLYASVIAGVSVGDLLSILLVAAVSSRLASLAWVGSSLPAALLDAALIPGTCVYLLLRYQRVLSYAPGVLAGVLILGTVLALGAAAVAWSRPRRLRAGAPEGVELGVSSLGVAWIGVLFMLVGVGAWRTAALLVLARGLDRLALRLLAIVAGRRALPRISAQVGRVALWVAAGLAPGLSFVALAQACVDVGTRASLLGGVWTALAALAVVAVAGLQAAAVAGLAEELLAGAERGREDEGDVEGEDGLDFGPLVLVLLGSVGLGVVALAFMLELGPSPLAWLDRVLPLAGATAPHPRGYASRRGRIDVAMKWRLLACLAVAAASLAAWIRARGGADQRARGATSRRLERLERRLIRRSVEALGLAFTALTELAARGVGRGLFEEGPRIAMILARDTGWDLRRGRVGARLGWTTLHGGRRGLLGLGLGFALLLGWLYAKPEVSSLTPVDDYGFGGLRVRLIRAGGHDEAERGEAPTPAVSAGAVGEGAELEGAPVGPALAPRSDGAERPPMATPPELEGRRQPGEVPR